MGISFCYSRVYCCVGFIDLLFDSIEKATSVPFLYYMLKKVCRLLYERTFRVEIQTDHIDTVAYHHVICTFYNKKRSDTLIGSPLVHHTVATFFNELKERNLE